MSLIFKPEQHEYLSMDDPNFKWVSVTSLISQFKKPFDADGQAVKSSKNRKSPWYGKTPDAIKRAWKNESKRAMDLGTWYHNIQEALLVHSDQVTREDGKGLLPVIKPLVNMDGVKYAPDQKLTDGVYPEHLVYLKSSGICGQSDRVNVTDGVVDIIDYKTNKEIVMKGYMSWDGKVQRMTSPISHIDDCNYYHYALQLSFYMYMIIKHNPLLKPGKLMIHHIAFEVDHLDENNYPVTLLDDNGNPVLRCVTPLELPYLKAEVMNIINWLGENKDKLKPKH